MNSNSRVTAKMTAKMDRFLGVSGSFYCLIDNYLEMRNEKLVAGNKVLLGKTGQ